MKYQLPTSHWIYFCAQIKSDKIDASGAGGNNNVATVLNQARMAIDHPIFDSDTNRKVLLDHLYLISAGEITRAARTWLVEQLDQGQRRHIIFMDRDEFLDQSARILLDLRLDSPMAHAAASPETFSAWSICRREKPPVRAFSGSSLWPFREREKERRPDPPQGRLVH
jgi:hypothetical protein